jgi:hypothetical protein
MLDTKNMMSAFLKKIQIFAPKPFIPPPLEEPLLDDFAFTFEAGRFALAIYKNKRRF